MKAKNFHTILIAAAVAVFFTVSVNAQDKMTKDTIKKISKMEQKKMSKKKMSKMSNGEMKKDSTKM